MRLFLIFCLLSYGARCENLWKEVKAEAQKEWNNLKGNVNKGVDFIEEEAKKDSEWIANLWNDSVDSDSDSKEEKEHSSEEKNTISKTQEIKEKAEEDDALITRCSDLCLLYSGHESGSNKQRIPASSLCSIGCRDQAKALNIFTDTFPRTDKNLLLGSALDKCYDECLRQRDTASRSLCNTGCETMKEIQKKAKSAPKTEGTKTKLEVDTKKKKTEEAKKEVKPVEKEKNNDIRVQSEYDGENDGVHHVLTYVLWRPVTSLGMGDQTYARIMSLVQSLLQGMELDEDSDKEPGWRGDRMQLRIPQRNPDPRAQRVVSNSDDEGVYARLTQSLDSIKDKVETVMGGPDFQQNIYYILIGVSAMLLIATAFHSIGGRRTPRDETQDHYYLSDPALGAKLPTYEDCVKADSDLVAGITSQEVYPTKESLPTFVVMEAVVAPAVNIAEPAPKDKPANNTNDNKEDNVA